mmetsp:Transcript_40544/g.133580  ORF Transcript_40544/g.133580 Transcript_40544/m.133580 type:complete len:161 (+) Transcript_40544:290-772(+)
MSWHLWPTSVLLLASVATALPLPRGRSLSRPHVGAAARSLVAPVGSERSAAIRTRSASAIIGSPSRGAASSERRASSAIIGKSVPPVGRLSRCTLDYCAIGGSAVRRLLPRRRPLRRLSLCDEGESVKVSRSGGKRIIKCVDPPAAEAEECDLDDAISLL